MRLLEGASEGRLAAVNSLVPSASESLHQIPVHLDCDDAVVGALDDEVDLVVAVAGAQVMHPRLGLLSQSPNRTAVAVG